MANEIDIVMDLDPLALAKTDGGLNAVIAVLRNRRAQAESGIKLKRDTGPAPKLDLAILGLTKPITPMKRKI